MTAPTVVTNLTREDVLDFLTSQPTLEQIIAFHPSDEAQERLRYLLDANRNGTLTDSERKEFDEIDFLEHFMRWVKIRALQKQQRPQQADKQT